MATHTMFEPLRIGSKVMRNRLVQAPMSVGYADHEGRPTRAMVEHYGRRALGGVGMVITENVAVSRVGRQMPLQPMLADRDALPAFSAVAAEIRRHGALAVAQIVHAGRYAGPWDVYESERRLAPSAIPFELIPGRSVRPAEISPAEIEAALEEFAATARLAEEAGFDGVELHGAQGFLMASFLSPRLNARGDEWGGPFENRIRFLMEAAVRVRAAVRPDFIVGLHLMSDERTSGGWALGDAIRLAPMLETVGLDFVMPVVCTFETLRSPQNAGIMGRPLFQHAEAAAIKGATRIPIFTNGRIDDPTSVSRVLAAGEADAVGLARPLLADPDWVAKVAEDRFDAVRICHCTGLCLRTQLTGSICECWPKVAKDLGYLGYEAASPWAGDEAIVTSV